ncbi:MAG TPA: hypothetical protein VFM96_11370 [Gaiellaceae bacterium]|nr:hypothetical protein [Gaiellaceae bacterium]
MGDLDGARIYLAARFARQAELRAAADELEEAGAKVVARWLYSPRALAEQELGSDLRGSEMAAMDLADIQSADVCIAFTETAGSPTGRGGRHTELGIALALGLRIIVVGPREHVFHCLPSIEHYETWSDVQHRLLSQDNQVALVNYPVEVETASSEKIAAVR